jgi:hypothetical protein
MVGINLKEPRVVFALVIYVILFIWGLVSPQFSNEYFAGGRFFGDFPSIYAVLALYGAYCGFTASSRWGGFNSMMGKSLIYYSLGLLFQVFGQITYAYYSFFEHVSVPYPSLGDIGYFGSIPLHALGVYYLAKVAGVNLGLKSYHNKISVIAVPGVILLLAYLLFLKNYTIDVFNAPLKTFLDFGYPFGQATYVSIALLTYQLSKNFLGGIMRKKIILIILALILQFLSDYTFLYQATVQTWSAGGLNDFMYLTSYLVMVISLEQFRNIDIKKLV